MDAITVKDLSFRYPQAKSDALVSVSFSVPQGAFVTLCGLSGSGKTTLLRQLKPALAPHGTHSGEILINGTAVESLSQREQAAEIGFVQQSPDNQIVTDKVWHELAFGLESLGVKQNEMRRRVAETASFFGIQSLFECGTSTLSGGQKQLLNLASVMVTQPSILLLDEPTAQLDPVAAADFLHCLQKINREFGTTVIIIEHRLEDVLPVSDRVLVMENGSLISDDTPENTGKNLRHQGSWLFMSLPAPMRVWHAVSEESEKNCPVTVIQGKRWLEGRVRRHEPVVLFPEELSERGDAAVVLKGVSFRYEKNAPDVIKNLSLSVYRGELLTIMGGNGTGKSTLLSLIGGSRKPYCGKVSSNGELCLTLPQNPQTLLNGKTVWETVNEPLEGLGLDKKERESRVKSAIISCGLENLLDRHPFDLSGGEMQKAALAKLLLLRPAILLLDEPTKGLDAVSKAALALILKRLAEKGTAVVVVSHDVEFCAKYSRRCLMMFNGELVAEGSPREFFGSNSFYVTSAARMARGVIPDAVTAEDVIYCLTGEKQDIFPSDGRDDGELPDFQIPASPKAEKKLPKRKRVIGIVGAVLLLFGILENLGYLPFLPAKQLPLWANFGFIAFPAALLMLAFGSLSHLQKLPKPQKQKLPKRTVASAVMILLMIPLTIYVGNVFLYDQKYLFISLLVLFECMLPFFFVFEGRKPQAREPVLIAVICALAVAGRAAFVALPQIKPVLALVIIGGVAFGGETGFIIGAVSMLVSNIYFGQGAWTPWQMFAAGIIGFLAGVLFRKGLLCRSRGAMCFFGFTVTVALYGGIMNFSSLVLSHIEINRASLAAFYAQGLPYDIIHAFSTVVFLFFFAEPMLEKLDRVKTKYGIPE